MATIIDFAERREVLWARLESRRQYKASLRNGLDEPGGEVVLFTGVRYERHEGFDRSMIDEELSGPQVKARTKP